jgi:hypothetical protein
MNALVTCEIAGSTNGANYNVYLRLQGGHLFYCKILIYFI